MLDSYQIVTLAAAAVLLIVVLIAVVSSSRLLKKIGIISSQIREILFSKVEISDEDEVKEEIAQALKFVTVTSTNQGLSEYRKYHKEADSHIARLNRFLDEEYAPTPKSRAAFLMPSLQGKTHIVSERGK